MASSPGRSPDETRQRLLEAAFEEFYRNGFQAGSLETIVQRAGVTKGALYHHFGSKADLGYAVVEEVIREPILEAYLGPLESAGDDPLGALQATLRRRADDFSQIGIGLGCPLNNLAQEMSPLDEGFRARVSEALDAWTRGIADALAEARAKGIVRADVDPERVARFVVASAEGSFGMAKAADSVDVLRANLEVLAEMLEGLRA